MAKIFSPMKMNWVVFIPILITIPLPVQMSEETYVIIESSNTDADSNGRRQGHKHHHHHKHETFNNPNQLLHDIQNIPNLEDSLPQSYVKTHQNEFKKFHGYAGRPMKQKKIPQNTVKMQYATMDSMGLTRRFLLNLARRLNPRVQLLQQLRRSHSPQPILRKDKLNHVGNSLFSINEKRILGAHNFPMKKESNLLYGNIDPPYGNVAKKRSNKHTKKYKLINADEHPGRLFDRKHPGLNQLYNDKMWLDSAKYKREKSNLVYGNTDNIGEGIGDDSRFVYTNFRRLTKPGIILRQSSRKKQKGKYLSPCALKRLSRRQADDKDSLEDDCYDISKSDESGDGTDASNEANPGNPYTVFKGKYRQNWPWNFKMDGDHMNVNPYAPKFDDMGPSGTELFFGRKWWYFNQDDFKPF